MVFLWFSSNRFPKKLWCEYDKANSPDRFIFSKSVPYIGSSKPLFIFPGDTQKVLDWNVLPNDAGLPLVDSSVVAILQSVCPKDVEFVDAIVRAADGDQLDYKVMNVLSKVACIDHEKSHYSLVPGGRTIMTFDKLVLVPQCLGNSHIARDAEYFPHILVSAQIKDVFRRKKIKGVSLLTPDQVFNF